MGDRDERDEGLLPPAVREALAKLRWADTKPSAKQVRGLAALATPLLAILGLIAFAVATFLGFSGRKGAAGAAGLAGIGALGGAVLGSVTAAKPDTVLDPKAGRILADRRTPQLRALGEAAQRLEVAAPAVAQAVLDALDDPHAPAHHRARAHNKELRRLRAWAAEVERSLREVGELGELAEVDAGAEVERAADALDELDRGAAERRAMAEAEAEVDALEDAETDSAEVDESERRAAAAARQQNRQGS